MNLTRALSTLRGTVPLARVVEGGALGVALWAMLLTLRVLPGATADYSWMLVAAGAGMVSRPSRLGRILTVLLVLVAALIVVVSATSLSEELAARWMRQDRMPDSGVAAIVALSAGVNPDTTMSSEALDHLLAALQMIREGQSAVLVTTAVRQQFPQHLVSSETDQSRIVALFGGGFTWIRNAPTTSTRQEAVAVAARLLPHGIRRIAVVTSPMHTRRACESFEAVGFSVTCVAARVRDPDGWPPSTWPVDRLARFGSWVYEVAGIAEYESRGWLAPRAVSARR